MTGDLAWVLDLGLKVSLVLAAAWGVTALMARASAASRHAVWVAACVATLLLPMARGVVPALDVSWWPAVLRPQAPDLAMTFETTAAVSGVTSGAAAAAGAGRSPLPSVLVSVMVLVWAAGAMAMLGRSVRGRRRARAIARATRIVMDSRITQRADVVAGWLGVRRYDLREGPADIMPATWGWRRPIVMVPAAARQWSDSRLDTVLVHELGHVRRRDAWWQTVADLTTALWWMQPLAWVAVRRLRDERERACDDLVLAFGTRATDYASDLVTLADECDDTRVSAASVMAMARRSQLEGRVMAILNPGVNRKGRTVVATLVAGAMALAIVPLAALRAASPAPAAPGAAPAPQDPQQAVRVGGAIKEPIKIKHVNPVYPDIARSARVQGIVILEVMIDAAGFVSDARVLRPVALLDDAALDAVRQWQFTPTELNGQPVPVIMTVTVAFRLDEGGNPLVAPPPAQRTVVADETAALRAQVAELQLRLAFAEQLAARGIPAPPQAPPPTWNAGDPPLRIGGVIKEPKKLKHVNAVYPPEAQDAKVQGIVILEISIDQDGRVSNARVIRPVALLDQAALDAVLQWEFEPTQLNGQPVPVIMTVTVNFTLGE